MLVHFGLAQCDDGRPGYLVLAREVVDSKGRPLTITETDALSGEFGQPVTVSMTELDRRDR